MVTVRLFLSHYPNYNRGVRGQEDTIHIKSAYFEQKVDVSFFLHSRDAGTTASSSRSPSPTGGRVRNDGLGQYSYDAIQDLRTQLAQKETKIKQMEVIISQLESKYPSLHEIVRSRVEQEKAIFEEKSAKVSIILCPKCS